MPSAKLMREKMRLDWKCEEAWVQAWVLDDGWVL